MSEVQDRYERGLREIAKKWRVKFVGASDEQIAEVEAARGRGLPESHRAFLKIAGASSPSIALLAGTDVFYPAAVVLSDWSDAMAAEVATSLRPEDVVVAMHQGYIVFFLRGESSDPPVYGWREGEESVKEVAPTLLDFIRDEAKQP